MAGIFIKAAILRHCGYDCLEGSPDLLREQQRQGTIAIDQIELAARQFISLVCSDIHRRAALGLGLGLSSKTEIRASVALAVCMSVAEFGLSTDA